MKKKPFKKLIIFLLCASLMTAFFLPACSSEKGVEYLIAYTNSTNDDVEYYSYAINNGESLSSKEIVDDLITKLFMEFPGDSVHYSPLPQDVKLNYYTLKDDVLTLDFSDEYYQLTNVQELILKACVVLTLVQVEDVESIVFTINGNQLADSEGKEIGAMNPDQYVDVLLSDEELLKQETSVRLYFADAEGTRLIPFDYSFTIDNKTQSLEEYIVRKLIEGPDEDNGYPTLDAGTELISVMTTDTTCYVNFSSAFLEQTTAVQDEIMIYSIVNSLCGLVYINNVQFLVDGDSDIILHKSFDLSKPVSPRYDLILSEYKQD